MLARLAFFLLLIAPPLALAADAPPSPGKITVVGPPKVAAAPAAPATPAQRPLIASLPPPDPSACRMDCAQTFYFCRAGEGPEDCASPWSQCVASCNSPSLAPPAAAAAP